MNVLALDASTKRTGYAFFKEDQLQYGAIASASTNVERRIGVMRDEIIKIIKENNIDTVIMEEIYPDGYNKEKVRPDVYNNHTNKVLHWLQGCIVVAIFELNPKIKVEFIGPSSWRSVIGIQGYRIKREQQKQKDIEYANKTYNLELKSSQDDEADAIGILAAYRQNNNIVESKPKTKLNPIGSDESAF